MRFPVLMVVTAAALLSISAPVVSGNTTFRSNGHSISFFDKGGNAWWVEVIIEGASATDVSGVDATDTGGAWVPLTHESWGAWAASFHVEAGHLVTYRAHFADATVITSCPFTHPEGVEMCGGAPPPAGFSATFAPKPGNEWWVETFVQADQPLAAVDARVNGTAWIPLTLRSWGAWAASFHVPNGSLVDFRARATDGDAATSGPYVWPTATPAPTPSLIWPREGSFVRAQREHSENVPGFSKHTERNETYLYHNGNWTLAWESWTFTHTDADPANDSFTRDSGSNASEPTRGPTWNLKIGHKTPYGAVTSKLDRNETRDGTTVVSRVWYAQLRPEFPGSIDAYWHTGTGLLLELFDARSHSGDSYRVIDTDAPLAKSDPLSGPPPRDAWPFAGSYANDAEIATFASGYNASNVSYSFQNGYWQGICVWHSHDRTNGDHTGALHFAAPPLTLPAGVAIGASIPVNAEVDPCSLAFMPDLTVRGSTSVTTERNGAPFSANAWVGNETDPTGTHGTASWDSGIGLLLRYHETQPIDARIVLTDTDAPLTKA